MAVSFLTILKKFDKKLEEANSQLRTKYSNLLKEANMTESQFDDIEEGITDIASPVEALGGEATGEKLLNARVDDINATAGTNEAVAAQDLLNSDNESITEDGEGDEDSANEGAGDAAADDSGEDTGDAEGDENITDTGDSEAGDEGATGDEAEGTGTEDTETGSDSDIVGNDDGETAGSDDAEEDTGDTPDAVTAAEFFELAEATSDADNTETDSEEDAANSSDEGDTAEDDTEGEDK